MAAAWLRLEARAGFVGWSSRLPAEQYAAFVKFLQAVKLYGERGTIQRSYLSDEFLRANMISPNGFALMLKAGISHDAFTTTADGQIVVNSWNHYQLDPTAAERQRKRRHGDTRDVTDVTTTGRDGTGRDIPPSSPPKGVRAADVQAVFNAWNDVAGKWGMRAARVLTNSRRVTLRVRLGDQWWAENWQAALKMLGQSRFARGKVKTSRWYGKGADLDWFLRPNTVTKALEGSYTGDQPTREEWEAEEARARLKRDEREHRERQQERADATAVHEANELRNRAAAALRNSED